MNPMILMLNLKATNVILLYKYSEKGRIGVFGMFQGLIGFGVCRIIVTEENMPNLPGDWDQASACDMN